jgi:hypothetical protein
MKHVRAQTNHKRPARENQEQNNEGAWSPARRLLTEHHAGHLANPLGPTERPVVFVPPALARLDGLSAAGVPSDEFGPDGIAAKCAPHLRHVKSVNRYCVSRAGTIVTVPESKSPTVRLPAREYRKAGPCGASGCQDAGSWHLAGEFRGTR